jgi:tRNA-specific 2-thiouridylase
MVNAGKAELHCAADPARDQSYFLFTTTQEQLDFLRFPLGGMATKADVRAVATRLGLVTADKPDSQDICFVPNGDYAAVVAKLRPHAIEPGEIVHLDGTVLGRHEGIIHYTIGQRKGLGIGGVDEPLYVLKLEPQQKRVIVGPKDALATRDIYVRELNWLAGDEAEVMVKLRSAMPAVPATLERLANNRAKITLASPHAAVAPGQAAVFYHEGRVLGGGWIEKAEATEKAA